MNEKEKNEAQKEKIGIGAWIWGNPKFCVTAKSGANREKFIMGGRRVKRLPPC